MNLWIGGAGILVTATLMALAPVWAENGRDFAGQYAVTNVVESAGTVWATFTLYLGNYSGMNIAGARLYLEAGVPGKPLMLAGNIALENHAHTRIQVETTVSLREFENWRQGGQPHIAVEFTDGNGKALRRTVELVRVPVITEVR